MHEGSGDSNVPVAMLPVGGRPTVSAFVAWAWLTILLSACGALDNGRSGERGRTFESISEDPEQPIADASMREAMQARVGQARVGPFESENGVTAQVDPGTILPIVFIHGAAGSAHQYLSQAMRWTQNGYPSDLVHAFEYDGSRAGVDPAVEDLSAFVQDLLETTDGYGQVYLVAHGRGTTVAAAYLADSQHLPNVAKYVAIDGAPCPLTVACLTLTQRILPGQGHVEVASSAESFSMQHAFLLEQTPDATRIEPALGPVSVAGRMVAFASNAGDAGGSVDFYPVDAQTGERMTPEPVASGTVGEGGHFGPVMVDGQVHYEIVAIERGEDLAQHFYLQPLLQGTTLLRLPAAGQDSEWYAHSRRGDGHANLVALRMREWRQRDVLEVEPAAGRSGQGPVDVMSEMVGDESIVLHMQDAADARQRSTLDALPWFPEQRLQAGIDVYLKASDPPDGTITLTHYPEGGADQSQTLSFPNWSSSKHSIVAVFMPD